MKSIRVGVDLAKLVFQVHGVNREEKPVLRRRLARDTWIDELIEQVEPGCVIGMESCAGAHHWARLLQSRGFTVKLMAPQFVKPYVKSNKNDANDAEAICEAMSRNSMPCRRTLAPVQSQSGGMANIEKQQYWTQRHEDWQRSGLSQRAYCQREGLSFPSFDYWRRRTRASVHVVPTTALPQTTHQLTLVPVQLDVAPCRGDIHLRSPAGWHITLSATLDHTILSQLLSQLP